MNKRMGGRRPSLNLVANGRPDWIELESPQGGPLTVLCRAIECFPGAQCAAEANSVTNELSK